MFVVYRKKPTAKRGKKKVKIEFVDFNAEPSKSLEPSFQTKQKNKSGKQKQKSKRQKVIRTMLTYRTLNNWCDYKSMLPEEIIVNRNYLNE